MRLNRVIDNKQDRQTDTKVIDIDALETASLEERISFLYEVTGIIIMNAVTLVERKDGRPPMELKE